MRVAENTTNPLTIRTLEMNAEDPFEYPTMYKI